MITTPSLPWYVARCSDPDVLGFVDDFILGYVVNGVSEHVREVEAVLQPWLPNSQKVATSSLIWTPLNACNVPAPRSNPVTFFLPFFQKGGAFQTAPSV